MRRPGHVSQSNSGAHLDDANVLDANRRPIFCGQDGIFDILQGAVEPDGADVHLLQADLDEAAAGVDVVDFQLLFHLADAQSVRDELGWVDAHLVFARSAAKVAYVHNVGNCLELLVQDPVFDRSLFHQVVTGIRAANRVPINLARQAPVRSDLRLNAGRHR